MSDEILKVREPVTGTRKLDVEELIVGANTVLRERLQLTGALAAQINAILNVDPSDTDYGLVVRVISRKSSTISAASRFTIQTSPAVQILAANANRRRSIIQNVGITIIYLSLGTVLPSNLVYHISLSPGSSEDDGTGSIFIDEMWSGRINAISSASSGRVVVAEQT